MLLANVQGLQEGDDVTPQNDRFDTADALEALLLPQLGSGTPFSTHEADVTGGDPLRNIRHSVPFSPTFSLQVT
jgi:hypothetical protein